MMDHQDHDPNSQYKLHVSTASWLHSKRLAENGVHSLSSRCHLLILWVSNYIYLHLESGRWFAASMAPVTILSACLINVVTEGVLYGIFFVLNAASVLLLCFPATEMTQLRHQVLKSRLQFTARVKTVLKKPMFIGAILLFISITGHWVCTIIRLFEAVVNYADGTRAAEYYADVSQDVYAVKTGFLEVALVTGDTMLVYRLWLVWSRNYYVIIVPCITMAGLVACGIGATYDIAQYSPGYDVFLPKSQIWILGDGLFTLVTNVYSSSLIAWRIWSTDRQTRKTGVGLVAGSSNLMSMLVIFVESALLYTSFTIIFIATYGAKSHIEAMAADCWAVMAGISFALINVRIGLGWARNSTPSTSTFARSQDPEGNTSQSFSYPMQPLAIHVHQVKDSVTCSEHIHFPDTEAGDSVKVDARF